MEDTWPGVEDETPLDLSHLTTRVRQQGISTRAELSKLEADNIRRVVVKYLAAKPSAALAPFDITWALKLHEEMFNEVWQWAGRTRVEDVNIGVPVYNIHGDLFGLLQDLPEWPGYKMPLLEQAARLHHRAVAIHPFPNGNGRWSRMLGNIWLRRNDAPIVNWPEDTIGQTSVIRKDYIAAIKKADAGDYSDLIAMHETYAATGR